MNLVLPADWWIRPVVADAFAVEGGPGPGDDDDDDEDDGKGGGGAGNIDPDDDEGFDDDEDDDDEEPLQVGPLVRGADQTDGLQETRAPVGSARAPHLVTPRRSNVW